MNGGRTFLLAAVPALLLAAGAASLWPLAESIGPAVEARRAAATYPAYSGVVIPPNLAPLNLKVLERGRKFCLRISAGASAPLEVFSAGGAMKIPPDAWRKLLADNAGGELRMDIYVKGDAGWMHFDTVHNRIAAEEIDPYVVYRYIPPIFNGWAQISIRQRDLRGFQERVLFDTDRSADPSGKGVGGVCINCHTFLNHGPEQMLLQLRPGAKPQIPAMITVIKGEAAKVDTRTAASAPAAYASWHPNGKLLAFSRNSIREVFHTAGIEPRDVVDMNSDLVIYSVGSGEVLTVPQISRPDRLETWPCWSPDGRYLYFSSTRLLWPGNKDIHLLYDKVQYDLQRIAYDPASGRWGQVETVVGAARLGKSASMPQISPDGRFLMFTGHDYGSFPIFQPGSDLYMVDLSRIESPPVRFLPAATGSAPAAAPSEPAPLAAGFAAPRKLDEINSPAADSYHSWSSNSHWVIFTSKRENGVFTRLYIAHLEADGRFGKPFLMPQEDPALYWRCLMNFNRPELIRQSVTVDAAELARAMNSAATRAKITGATSPDTAPGGADGLWQH
jgi:hypothetical protein